MQRRTQQLPLTVSTDGGGGRPVEGWVLLVRHRHLPVPVVVAWWLVYELRGRRLESRSESGCRSWYVCSRPLSCPPPTPTIVGSNDARRPPARSRIDLRQRSSYQHTLVDQNAPATALYTASSSVHSIRPTRTAAYRSQNYISISILISTVATATCNIHSIHPVQSNQNAPATALYTWSSTTSPAKMPTARGTFGMGRLYPWASIGCRRHASCDRRLKPPGMVRRCVDSGVVG